jgi:hypothetical protein
VKRLGCGACPRAQPRVGLTLESSDLSVLTPTIKLGVGIQGSDL